MIYNPKFALFIDWVYCLDFANHKEMLQNNLGHIAFIVAVKKRKGKGLRNCFTCKAQNTRKD